MGGDDEVTSPSAPRKTGGVKALLAQLESKNKEAESHSTPGKRKTPLASPAGSFKARTPSNPGSLPDSSKQNGENEQPNEGDTVVAQPAPATKVHDNADENAAQDSSSNNNGTGSAPELTNGARRPSGSSGGFPSQAPNPQAPPAPQHVQQQPRPGTGQPPIPPNERPTPNAVYSHNRVPQGRPPAGAPQMPPNAARAQAVNAPPAPPPARAQTVNAPPAPPQARAQAVNAPPAPPASGDAEVLSDYPQGQSPNQEVERQWRSDVESRWKMEADRHKQAAHEFAKVAKQSRTDAERAREALEASERRLQMEEMERKSDAEDFKRQIDSLTAEVQGYRTLRDSNIGDNVEVQTKMQELEGNVADLNAQQHEMLQELRMRDEAIDEYRLQIQSRQASETQLRADVEQQLIHLQSAFLNEQAGRKAAEAEISKLLSEREMGSDGALSVLQEKERQILGLREELMRAKSAAPLPPPPASVIESDLRRLQTIVDMKNEEMNRLKKQFEAVSQERDELRGAVHERGVGGVPLQMPPADHTANQLTSLTEEKDKTISDLLVLQDDMVKELHSMREDLATLAQRNTVVEEERAYLSEQLNALYSQQQQQQQQGSGAPAADVHEVQEREKVRQLEEAERRERYMEQARAQMEEALQNARGEMVKAMHAAQEERAAAVAEAEEERAALVQETEAERAQLLARLASAREQESETEELRRQLAEEREAREHIAKAAAAEKTALEAEAAAAAAAAAAAREQQTPSELEARVAQAEKEKERLQRMLTEQGRGLIKMQKQQDNTRLAELREQVLGLDRSEDPTEAVRALQKVVVEQKLEEEGRRSRQPGVLTAASSASNSRSTSRGASPAPQEALALRPPQPPPPSTLRAAAPLRASMPEQSLRDALFAPDDQASPIKLPPDALSRSHDGAASPSDPRARRDAPVVRLARSVSPPASAPPPAIAEDILNYMPPSTKQQRDRLSSPELSEARRPSPPKPPTPEVVRAAPHRPPPSPASPPPVDPGVKGMTPSEYLAQRARKGLPAPAPALRQPAPAASALAPAAPSPARERSSALVGAGRVREDEGSFSPERLDRFAQFQEQLMNQEAAPAAEGAQDGAAGEEEWEVGLSNVQLTPDGAIMPVVRGPTLLPGIEEEDQNDPRRWSRESRESADKAEVVVDEEEEEEEEEYDDPEEYDPVKEESGRVKLPPPKSMSRFGV